MVEAGCTISRELLDSLPELLKLVSRQLPSPIEVGSADSLRPPPNAPTSCSENGPVSVGPSHSDKEKSVFSSTAVDASAADAADSQAAADCPAASGRGWLRPKPVEALLASADSCSSSQGAQLSEDAPSVILPPPAHSILGKRKSVGLPFVSESHYSITTPSPLFSSLSSSFTSSSSVTSISTAALASALSSLGSAWTLSPTSPALPSSSFTSSTLASDCPVSACSSVSPVSPTLTCHPATDIQSSCSQPPPSNVSNSMLLEENNLQENIEALTSSPSSVVDLNKMTASSKKKGKRKRKKENKTARLRRTLGLINRIIGTRQTTNKGHVEPGHPIHQQKIERILTDRQDYAAQAPISWPVSWSAGVVNGSLLPNTGDHSIRYDDKSGRTRHRSSQEDYDADYERHDIRQLLHENRKLQAELDRCVAEDRALVRRERHNLEDYRRSVEEERRLCKEADAAAFAARTKLRELEKLLEAQKAVHGEMVRQLEQQLEAQAAAHDEEVNDLFEKLLAEKQQVLAYCDQGTTY